MRHLTGPTRWWLWAVLLLLVTPAADASSFGEYLGRGIVDQVLLHDDTLSKETGTDVAYEIQFTKWSPDESNGKVIIYNHGLQSHRGWYNRTAGILADAGYTVYAFDRIGSGGSSDGLSERKGELISARAHIRCWELFVDTLDRMVRLAREEHPGADVVLWGNSYGAKVVTAYLFRHAAALDERGVRFAVFTTPGLYTNNKGMPLAFSKIKLLMASALDRFPVPMLEHDNDNGAAWFVAPGPWFDKIRQDDLSLRDATRTYWLETRAMDKYIAARPKSARFPVPTFHLLVRGDRMMDNDKVETHLDKHGDDGLFKYYAGGANNKHFLLFTEDADEAIGDIRSFLEGRRAQIKNVGL